MSAEWEPLSISTPPPETPLLEFHRSGHVDLAAEAVLVKDDAAQDARLHDRLRLDDVVHVPELRRHHEDDVLLVAQLDEVRGVGEAIVSGFSHSTWTPRSRKWRAIP
jgi:hypothetical protein